MLSLWKYTAVILHLELLVNIHVALEKSPRLASAYLPDLTYPKTFCTHHYLKYGSAIGD